MSAKKKQQPASVVADINKRYGEDALVPASSPKFKRGRLPTGILAMDWLLSGGFPRGRHVELYGGPGVGKTAVSYRTIATTQAAGGRCAFFDNENTFDPTFAAHLGVDVDALLYHRQEHGNRVLNLMEVLLRSGEVDLIVMDSIAALLPVQEFESDLEESSYDTSQAKLMSKGLRKLTAANQDTVILYINQMRENIGVVFGKRWITSGGKSMGYYGSTRIEMTKTETLKKERSKVSPTKGGTEKKKVPAGHRIIVRVEKDKAGSARTGDMATLVFDYDRSSFDEVEDLLYVGQLAGLVRKRGTRWYIGKKELGQRHRAKAYLEGDADARGRLESKIREKLSSPGLVGRSPEGAQEAEEG